MTPVLDSQILEDILFYFNSVEQVVSIFAKLNTTFRDISFNHLSKRIVLMHEETKRYEEAYADVVQSINTKRERFYKQYEKITGEEIPSKEKALKLL